MGGFGDGGLQHCHGGLKVGSILIGAVALSLDVTASRENEAALARERNLLQKDSLLSVNTPPPADLHLPEILEACALQAGWKRDAGAWQAPELPEASSPVHRRAIGLAIGFKNVGFSSGYPEESSIAIELHGQASIERAVVRYAGAECGQGTHTAISQIAADALGVPFEVVELVPSDTANTPESGSASASRLTLMAGNAVLGAAEAALQAWRDENRPAAGSYTYHAPLTTNFNRETGSSVPNFAYSCAAQAVESEVNLETGEISVQRVVTAMDVGRAINPVLIRSQVDGSVAQAVGYSLMENYLTEAGRALTATLSTYLVPTVLDVPLKSETVILELAEPTGPYGARGIGETALMGVAPSIATGLHASTGAWCNRLPMIPPVVLAALGTAAG